MVREFSIVQSTVVDHKELYRKRAKKIVGRRWKFYAKSAGRCFTPVIEIKPNTVVFIETSTQTYSLSEEDFGYNYGRLKSSASHASRENTSLRCGKIPKRLRRLQRASDVDGRGL